MRITEYEATTDLGQESKKRKRTVEAPAELEVDIHAPEPPSKKALRKAKKEKLPIASSTATTTSPATDAPQDSNEVASVPGAEEITVERASTSKRSEHGIWIGNLPYTITKGHLRTFFTDKTDISETTITRVHIPPPSDASSSRQRIKPQNKGFAYLDFSTAEDVAKALALSETLLMGRKVLIKDAHNFEGRPEKKADDAEDPMSGRSKLSGKAPNKRIFVGNLTFDTEKEDLEQHFGQCGEVADVHVATFEDSGKCKGYAWVTFGDIGAAEAAVKGFVMKKSEDMDEVGDEGDDVDQLTESREQANKKKKKQPKDRKWWVNKLKGRPLRMEFAEDATVRYKKRFGKDAPARANEQGAPVGGEEEEEEGSGPAKEAAATPKPKSLSSVPLDAKRPPRPSKKVDARNIKPGAALAAAPRLTGGIVASRGKKITFD